MSAKVQTKDDLLNALLLRAENWAPWRGSMTCNEQDRQSEERLFLIRKNGWDDLSEEELRKVLDLYKKNRGMKGICYICRGIIGKNNLDYSRSPKGLVHASCSLLLLAGATIDTGAELVRAEGSPATGFDIIREKKED